MQEGKNSNAELIRIQYLQEPDYSKPIPDIPPESRDRLFKRLRFLYGETLAEQYLPELIRIMRVHCAYKSPHTAELEERFDPAERFTERDMILITYGDLVRGDGGTPLATLANFLDSMNRGAINTIHLLPFFPYSSDRGFAIINFRAVDPRLGSWQEIHHMGERYQLMFDGVLNHCSSHSRMFREFLADSPDARDFFIAYDSPDDLTMDQRSKIFRPRTTDILSRYDTINGPKWVWTTFSADQIDFNFRNPKVLMSVLEGLLFYVRQGADILRLDAVTYIWAEPGTECVHLPQTHEIIKLLRDVFTLIAPGVALITETNVPHKDNISYFGDGSDEAHMVYNFALPPLTLHTFYREDSTALTSWARDIGIDSPTATFFNILDTHDGIGVMAARDILPPEDIEFIISRAKENGAYVSYKMTENKDVAPYEINTTWWSALNNEQSGENVELQVRRMAASRAVAMVLQGVPGVYAHGIIGTVNDHELVKETNHKRDVNRGAIDAKALAAELREPDSKLSLISRILSNINLKRVKERAFHPHGAQKVFMVKPELFTVLRTSPEGDQTILALINVTSKPVEARVALSETGLDVTRWYDIVNERDLTAADGFIALTFQPYDVVWLKPHDQVTQ